MLINRRALFEDAVNQLREAEMRMDLALIAMRHARARRVRSAENLAHNVRLLRGAVTMQMNELPEVSFEEVRRRQ